MTRATQIAFLCVFTVARVGCCAPDAQGSGGEITVREDTLDLRESDAQESALVRACFDGYKEAILDQDGDRAVGMVDETTLKYYGRMRELALHGKHEDVRDLSTTNKLMVLMLRHLIPLDALTEMTSESLFVYAVGNGWIGRASVISNEVGDIGVGGTSATGVHVFQGQETPFKWIFRKEEGGWKINLTSMMVMGDQALKMAVRKSGLPENDFLFSVLESVSGRRVQDTVWQPLTGVAE